MVGLLAWQPGVAFIGDGLNTAGFRFISPAPLTWNTYIARLDYNLNEAGTHNVFVRGNLKNDPDLALPQFPGEPPNRKTLNNSKGLAGGYNAVFRPNLVGTFRYGYTRQGSEHSGLQVAPAVSFLPLDDRYGLTTPFVRITPVHTFTQDLTWMRRAHNDQFGAVQRLIRNGRQNWANSYHAAQSRASWLLGSGSGLEAILPDLDSRFRTAYQNAAVATLGLVSQGTARYNYDLGGNVQAAGAPVVRNFDSNEYEFHPQDAWRVGRAFTSVAREFAWGIHVEAACVGRLSRRSMVQADIATSGPARPGPVSRQLRASTTSASATIPGSTTAWISSIRAAARLAVCSDRMPCSTGSIPR